MKRVSLTDGSGNWFDYSHEDVKIYKSNREKISGRVEEIIKTGKGNWVKSSFSKESPELIYSTIRISENDARNWLISEDLFVYAVNEFGVDEILNMEI